MKYSFPGTIPNLSFPESLCLKVALRLRDSLILPYKGGNGGKNCPDTDSVDEQDLRESIYPIADY